MDEIYEIKDIRKYYGDKQKTIEYLGDKDVVIWDFINLLVYTYEIIDKCKELKYKPFSLSFLFCNFVNHVVTTYKLLIENMEQEYYIMLRQCYEVLWKLKYFIKYRNKEREWILHNYNPKEYKQIESKMIRRGFSYEVKENMDFIYGQLSNFVHCNFNVFNGGIGLGGFYDERTIDYGVRHIIVLINEMFILLYKILADKENHYLQYNKKEGMYIVKDDIIKDNNVIDKLKYSLKKFDELALKTPSFFFYRDYEGEALEKLIQQQSERMKQLGIIK